MQNVPTDRRSKTKTEAEDETSQWINEHQQWREICYENKVFDESERNDENEMEECYAIINYVVSTSFLCSHFNRSSFDATSFKLPFSLKFAF